MGSLLGLLQTVAGAVFKASLLTSLVALAGYLPGPRLLLLAGTPNHGLSVCPHSMPLGSQSRRAWQGLHCLLGLSFRNHTGACSPYLLELGSLKGPSSLKRRYKLYFFIGRAESNCRCEISSTRMASSGKYNLLRGPRHTYQIFVNAQFKIAGMVTRWGQT